MYCQLLLPVFLGVVVSYQFKYKKNVMFTARPGETTCFLKKISRHKIIEVEYQVLEFGGNRSNQSITFDLVAPSGRRAPPRSSHRAPRARAAASQRWPAGAHVFAATIPGVYRFCFDNSFDDKNKKFILLNLTIRSNNKKLKKEVKSKKGRKQRNLERHIQIESQKEPLPWLMGEIDENRIIKTYTSRRNNKRRAKKSKYLLKKQKSMLQSKDIRNDDKLVWMVTKKRKQKPVDQLKNETIEENDKDTRVVEENKNKITPKQNKQYRIKEDDELIQMHTTGQSEELIQQSNKKQPVTQYHRRTTPKYVTKELNEDDILRWLVSKNIKNGQHEWTANQKIQKKTLTQQTEDYNRIKSIQQKEHKKTKYPTEQKTHVDNIEQEEDTTSYPDDDDDDEEEEMMFPQEEYVTKPPKTTTKPVFVHSYNPMTTTAADYDSSGHSDVSSDSLMWMPYRWDMIE